MEIQNLKPRSGFDTIRLGDSDELVVMENFGSLPKGELWNISKYGEVSLSDLPYLKRHPIMHLTDDDVKLLDDYFQLLCRRMRDPSPVSSVKKVKKYKSNKYRQATGQE
jgi:hypothetical protein